MKNDNSFASILKNYFEGMDNIEKEEVDNLIHCILNYIDEDTEEEEDEDYAIEEDEWDTDDDKEDCCGGRGNCDGCKCHMDNKDTLSKSENIQTITFTPKSGQVLGCCTDEDIVSIKVMSSDGKMSIFNL